MPSRQRAEACRLAFARAARKRGEAVWRTPDILPLDTWLAREIDRRARSEALPRLMSSAQNWLIWRQCSAGFTDGLELVAKGALAEGLRAADELANEYLIPVSAHAAGAEGRLLYEVRRAVRARQTDAGVASVRALAAELNYIGDARPVELAGFASVPPYLARLIEARSAHGFTTTLRASADAAQRAAIVAASDRTQELERIAAWAIELLQARAEARILIVLPGAQGAREQLATLLQQGLDPKAAAAGSDSSAATLIGIEGGEPLSRAPLVAHALTSLAMLTRALDFEEFSSWLCAGYWNAPDTTARARIDLALRRAAPLEVDLRALVQLLGSAAIARQPNSAAAHHLSQQLTLAATHLEGKSATPREWAVRIRAALDALGFPGLRARTSYEEQTLARFNELLNEFGELSVAARSMTRAEALQIFAELALRTAFRPASGDALITITARLEDPLIRYQGIWVAGLDAGNWPAAPDLNPFLSAVAQRAAGIPAASAAGRTAEARRLMLSWRGAADELIFSHALRDEDLEVAASPLFGEWTHAAAQGSTQPAIWLPARLHRDGVLESFVDASAPAWPAADPVPSGTRMLELQMLCAFRAVGELRLGSAPLETPAPGVTPLERGELIHAALEILWGVLKDSQSLQKLPPQELATLIARSVQEAADELWGPAATPAQIRERRRAAALITSLCELERGRAHFSVRNIEFESNVQLAGGQLRLRIDRIDALADGGLAILDYKSGAYRPMDWYGEYLSHPQLLAYLAAIGDEVRAVATVNIAAKDVRFAGIAAQADLLPRLAAAEALPERAGAEPWSASRDFWYARIESLARDFLAGKAEVAPAPHACDYCEVQGLCRIADHVLQSDPDEMHDE